jgi:pilus assembly protein Flp/PilA
VLIFSLDNARHPATQVNQMQLVRSFVRGEDGATAIEYALLASMIAMAIVAGVQLMGTQLSTVYVQIGNALN